jgi:hypothetical protein
MRAMMMCPFGRPVGAVFLCGAVALAAGTARAEGAAAAADTDHWRLVVSPISYHFQYSPEHRYVWALGAEYQRRDEWFSGGAYFSNSFGQPSGYLYVGRRWTGLWDTPQLYAQASGGLMYGYRGKYENKVPLNHHGYSPGALVSLGWQLDRQVSVSLHLLGFAGLMVQLGYELR